jgi:Mn2+/Fe2+ NRAMP family transporter
MEPLHKQNTQLMKERTSNGPLKRSLLSRIARIFLVIGPGIIVSNADNDAGGVTTASIAGATYGYSLLWVLILLTIMLVVVQEIVARIGAYSGKGLLDLVRERFGVRWATFVSLVIFVANGGTVLVEVAGVSAALLIFGVPRFVSVPIAIVLTLALLYRGSYRFVERILLLLGLVFISYLITAFVVRPNWLEMGMNIIHPSIAINNGYILFVIALAGTTVTPYMQLYLQSSVAEKGITLREYTITRGEVIAGSIWSDIVEGFIIITCAAGLYYGLGHGHPVPINDASQAARALMPLAGKYASVLFAIGFLGAALLALSVVPISTAYGICEAFGFENGIDKSPLEAPFFFGLLAVNVIVAGILVLFVPDRQLFPVIVDTQALEGILLPIIMIFLMLIANDSHIMSKGKNGKLANIMGWLFTAAMVILSPLAMLTLLGILQI